MVSEEMKCPTFHKVVKMLDGKIGCQEFLVECTIPGLGRSQLLGEVGDGAPVRSNALLENCTNGDIGGI